MLTCDHLARQSLSQTRYVMMQPHLPGIEIVRSLFSQTLKIFENRVDELLLIQVFNRIKTKIDLNAESILSCLYIKCLAFLLIYYWKVC